VERQRAYDDKVEMASEGERCVSKKMLLKELEQGFRNLETVKMQIKDLDQTMETHASCPNIIKRN
jgi:hypothetical protein